MAKLLGMHQVLLALGKEINNIENRTLKGLIKAGIIIRRGTEKVPPVTPLDLGNLRASWFIATSKGTLPQGKTTSFKGEKAGEISGQHSQLANEYATLAAFKGMPTIIMGYTANYAMAVHENVGATFQRPNAGAKWLESAIKRNASRILTVIQNEAKIS